MITDRKQQIPVFNFSLEDLEGEVWRNCPKLEKYIQVSQYGRVKRLPRVVRTSKGDIRMYGKRIFKSIVNSKPAVDSPVDHFELICVVHIRTRIYTFRPEKMVYYLFVKRFPLKNPKYTIVFKNGNDLDIRPENLELVKTRLAKQDYQKNNESMNHDRKIKFYKKMSFSKAVINRRNSISCYSQEGERMNTYNSLQEAHDLTGLPLHSIEKAISEPYTKLSNFYWRTGKRDYIDLTMIKKEEARLVKELTGMKITQFDLNGRPINHYLTLEDAALDNNIPENEILMALNHKDRVAGYFLWREGKWHTKIPGI